MLSAQKRTQSLGQENSVVACDLGIYQIARKIKEVDPDVFRQTVVRIVAFHLLMKFMEVIGDRYGNAGLSELLSRSGLYGDSTIRMILLGKAYNKAVRSMKLIYEACFRLIFAEMVKEEAYREMIRNILQNARLCIKQYASNDDEFLETIVKVLCSAPLNSIIDFVTTRSLASFDLHVLDGVVENVWDITHARAIAIFICSCLRCVSVCHICCF